MTLQEIIERELAAGPVTDGELASRLGHARANVRNALREMPHAIDAKGMLYPADSDAGRAAGALEHRPVPRPPSDSERAEAKLMDEVVKRTTARVLDGLIAPDGSAV